ncbi:transcription factor SPT20-like protein [Gossypium australe]|uniref:Transcription factor SPT20-like protein n=1 Tax=Gossypium australe TaxID=47621 RepID=A0A5B6WWL1_9ROSI|nr:transcription factor SPT20-like protein [Gossypium australe]
MGFFIGCPVHICSSKMGSLNKLDFHSYPCTFLGYSSQHKGYQCLTPDGKSSPPTPSYPTPTDLGTGREQHQLSSSIGYSLVLECDFKETFCPVVKPTTIRTILSVVVSNSWQLYQVDVNNTFLNGDLIDALFMQQSAGYVQYGPNGESLVCHLKKVLYGQR